MSAETTEDAPDCATCGHPASHHDAGECWTAPDGSEVTGHSACDCPWYVPVDGRPPDVFNIAARARAQGGPVIAYWPGVTPRVYLL